MKQKPSQKILTISCGILLAGLSTQSARAADGTWAPDAAGNWSDTTKWVGGTIADGIGATATFNPDNTAARTATIDTTSRTLGILNLSGATTGNSGTINWTIAASGGAGLTLDNTSAAANAVLNVVNRNFISAPITLNSNLTINKSSSDATGTNLNITGGITAAGKTVTINGTGTAQQVSVTGTTTFTGGSWVVNNATLNMNTGFKGDSTTTVSLGTGAGDSQLQITSATLVAGNTITVGAGGTSQTLRNVSGTSSTGSVVLNGTLNVLNASGSTLNLAGATGATITGAGGLNLVTATGSGGAVTIAGAASHTGTNTLTGGNLTVSAAGSLNGSSTVVNTGRTFTLAATADYGFDIGANGVNDSITGVGTVSLNGDFVFNLASANTTAGNTWQIVDNANLTETFSGTFTVANAGAVEAGDVWSFTNAGTQYQFSEATGALTVVPEPSTLTMLVGGLGMLVGFRRTRRSQQA